jgi:hypothetical protein
METCFWSLDGYVGAAGRGLLVCSTTTRRTPAPIASIHGRIEHLVSCRAEALAWCVRISKPDVQHRDKGLCDELPIGQRA